MVVPARSGTTMPRLRRTASCCEMDDPGRPVRAWISPTLRGPPRRNSRIEIRTGWASALKNSALNCLSRTESSGRGDRARMAAQPSLDLPIDQVFVSPYLRNHASTCILCCVARVPQPRGHWESSAMTQASGALATLLADAREADPAHRIDLRD